MSIEDDPSTLPAYSVAVQMIRALKPALDALRHKNQTSAREIEEAAVTIPVKLREGLQLEGKERLRAWRLAASHADQVRASLDVAVALGELDLSTLLEVRILLDRVLTLTWKLID